MDVQHQAHVPVEQQPEPLWQGILRRSFLQFPCPNLESEYQAYVGSQRWGYVLAFAPTFFISWFSTFHRAFKDFRAERFELPPGLLLSMPLFFLPTVALMAFICVWPKAYAKHWRRINAAFMLVHIFSTTSWQWVMLWQSAANEALGGRFSVQAFMVENCYLTIICLRVLVFPTGQASDIVFTVLGMVTAMAGNASVCASPLFGARPSSLSPAARSVAQSGCAWLLAMLSAHGVIGRCPELTCPAVLAFWQLLGFTVACLLVIVSEVISRRQFLKSSVARLGPALAARAARWPLGGAKIMHNLICAVVGVCVMPAVLMPLALYAFQ